jgi:hypothetical protein
VEEFAVAVMVKEPLLLPLVGETVSQLVPLDFVAVHDTLEVTVILVEVPPLAKKL